MGGSQPVWLFDLDNTLHNASHAAFGFINQGMSDYIVRELGVSRSHADELRQRYWKRYGTTMLGLLRHHGVQARHFLEHTHALPGLEERVHSHPHDVAVLRRLRGRRYILTNAPLSYAMRVLQALGIAHLFDGVLSIEDMRMFGHWRPKPDARMLRRTVAALRVHPSRCILVEDALEHQKAARRVGMRTVWMQRWARGAGGRTVASEPRCCRPAYVDRRISRLRDLLRK